MTHHDDDLDPHTLRRLAAEYRATAADPSWQSLASGLAKDLERRAKRIDDRRRYAEARAKEKP